MDDMISRQAAIDALGEQGLITAAIVIDHMPSSAQPERKKGRWLWELADNGWADHI